MAGNDRPHVAISRLVEDAHRIVAGVPDERPTGRMVHQLLCNRRFVLLTGRYDDVERTRGRVDDGVELGRKATATTTQSVAADPPFPPAAS